MTTEQPLGDSEQGLLERLGNALVPDEAPSEPEAIEASQPDADQEEQQPEATEQVEPPQDEPELFELETEEGKVEKVSRAVKDGYMRTADYTRKTQDLAALTKQAHSVLQEQKLIASFNESTREDQQRLAQIKGELSRYRQTDLTNLDTDAYIKTRAYIDQLKDQASEIEQSLSQKAQQVQQTYQQHRQESARNAYEFISRQVKDWQPNSQTERDVAAYASENGIPPDVLRDLAVTYPAAAIALYKARQFDMLQGQKGSVVKAAQKAPPVVKPGAAVQQNQGVAQRYKKDREALKTSGSRDAGIRIFERLLSKG